MKVSQGAALVGLQPLIGGLTQVLRLTSSQFGCTFPLRRFGRASFLPHRISGLLAWAVKSDQMIDSSGVKFPAYFLSADIVAPSGEAVVGTWVTTEITKPGLIYSVSPQAKKYSSWAQVGDASTAGITTNTPGAKESSDRALQSKARQECVGLPTRSQGYSRGYLIQSRVCRAPQACAKLAVRRPGSVAVPSTGVVRSKAFGPKLSSA
jgi:hypothetical protein